MAELTYQEILDNILPDLKESTFKKPLEIEKLTLEEYLNTQIDIQFFWKLLKGFEFNDEVKISYNLNTFNKVPTKIELPTKYELCESVFDSSLESNDETKFIEISDYNLNLSKIFELYKDVFPINKNGKIHFYPILSPLWIKNGNPKKGYLNLDSKWIKDYIDNVTALCLERNDYYQKNKYLDTINIKLYYNSVNINSNTLKEIVLKTKDSPELKIEFTNFIKKQQIILQNIKKISIIDEENFNLLLRLILDGKNNINLLFKYLM